MNMDRVNYGVLESVDARTKLAGSNRMEILLFSLGTQEIFGINVFKVREVSRTPFITKAPNMPVGVEGLISLRGNVIPVLALARVMGISEPGEPLGESMMVTEYSKRTLGFLVHEVDRIIRVEWDKVRAPDNVTSSGRRERKSRAALSSIVAVIVRSPTVMFTFREVSSGVPGLSDSSRPAPISSSYAGTRVAICESPEDVSNRVRSITVASGHRLRASLTDVEIPLLPLVANSAIRFPASFAACSCRNVCIGVAMLLYQMG